MILLLADAMYQGAEIGCFLSQRGLAEMIPCDHKTAGKSLQRLRESGWVDAEPRRSQYGRIGYVWRPAIPDAAPKAIGDPKDSPINKRSGESIAPQSQSSDKPIGEPKERIGESPTVIGELLPRIGDSRTPQNSSYLNSSNQKSLNQTQVNKPTQLRVEMSDQQLAAVIRKLMKAGYREPHQIVHQLGTHNITIERASTMVNSIGAGA